MKTTKELKIWSLRMVLFTILLSGLSVQAVMGIDGRLRVLTFS